MLTNLFSFYTWEVSQRLNPQNYARIALVFVELKCESTNSEGRSCLAQDLSKLEGGKWQCSHSMFVCSVYFSERKKSTLHTFTRLQIEKKKKKITLIFPRKFWKAISYIYFKTKIQKPQKFRIFSLSVIFKSVFLNELLNADTQ